MSASARSGSESVMRLAGFVEVVLDLVFPPRCLGCRTGGAWLCTACLARAPRPTPPLCRTCGRPGRSPCDDCRASAPGLDELRPAVTYEGAVRTAILALKFRRGRHLAAPLATLLAEVAPRDADVLLAVPHHPARQRARGFNQAELLCDRLVALGFELDRLPGLARVRNTRPQVGLSAAERRTNVRGAFAWHGDPLVGSHVLLVDDVRTTGSTLNECAKVLKAAGAGRVTGLVVAGANGADGPGRAGRRR